MLKSVKIATKALFSAFGLKIQKKPQFDKYTWLKRFDINTIVDIGANTGQFALQFHSLFPDANIYSFEPLAECYGQLLENMKNTPNFEAFNFALGDEIGRSNMHKNEYTPSSSLLSMENVHKDAFPFAKDTIMETIEIKKLDDVFADKDIVENILVKIDVQGTEDKVIRGGSKVISRASVIIVETSFKELYSGQPLFDAIYSLLKTSGFELAGFETPLYDPKDGSILQCDSIFIRK